jgi:uncharacterized protein YfaS (alpha-2-macroglobulin family)
MPHRFLVLLIALLVPIGAATAASWKDVEALIEAQKLEEADTLAKKLLDTAIQAKDEALWTRALVGRLQLRSALDGYETAVRELKAAPWPDGLLSRSTVELFYAHALITYLKVYAWEIEQREEVASQAALGLQTWTKPRIVKEATSALQAVWQERAALGKEPIGKLEAYVEKNDYPPGIRGTLRDMLTYMTAALLADTSTWTPAESNEIHRLQLDALLGREPAGKSVALDDSALHPLARLAAALADLEGWHEDAHRLGAALEARLERVRRLSASFGTARDKRQLALHLEKLLPSYEDDDWWTMGMAELASLYMSTGDLVTAHARAAAAAAKAPKSVGGQKALALQARLEAPEFSLLAMRSDAAKRRSIEVTHKNLPKLYFRAYALDLAARLTTSTEYNVLPSGQELAALLKGGQKPVASWSVDLPATPDFSMHKTYVTPPLEGRGLYVIYASASEDFREEDNRVLATTLIISDLVLVTRQSNEGRRELTVTVLDGPGGAPVKGAEVSLMRLEYGKKPALDARKETDALGTVTVAGKAASYGSYLVYAKTPRDAVLDPQPFYLEGASEPEAARSVFVYTDRSIYRPGQKLQWKVVAYRGSYAKAEFKVDAGASLTVSLLDANYEVVAKKVVKANDFGSASGVFDLPESGRLLGQWQLQVSPGDRNWPVRVEEYKRPTFQVRIEAPEQSLRLNEPATLKGEARYYFGQPVTDGKVRWRVAREPVYAWWWLWRAQSRASASQQIATGTSTVDDKGRFTLSFLPEAPPEPESPGISYNYLIKAELTDEGGETREASRSLRLGYVSVETSLEVESGFYDDGAALEIAAHRRDLDGTPRAGAGRFRLLALRQPATTLPPSEQPLGPGELPQGADEDAEPEGDDSEETTAKTLSTPGDALRPRWTSGFDPAAAMALWPDGDEIESGALTHDDKGVATIKLPALRPGAYRLRYETKDEKGASFETWRDLVVAGKTGNQLAVPAFFRLAQGTVEVGGKVRALAHSGFASQPLLLEVHRAGKLLERRLIRGGELIERPVGEADRGGFVMTLTAVHDHQLMQFSQAVYVPWDDRELTVDFARFRDELEPGAKESWRITVKRKKPGPKASTQVAAELLAYMYDKSLDAIAPHATDSPLGILPDRASAGYARGSLGSSYGQSFGRHRWRQLPSAPSLKGDLLKQLSGNMHMAVRRSMRGGGPAGLALESPSAPTAAAPMAEGAAPPAQAEAKAKRNASYDLADKVEASSLSAQSAAPKPAQGAPADAAAAPEQPLRTNFSETAFFFPHLLLDKNGGVTIDFQVPDAVTAWTVWAHALTKDLKAGSAVREMRSVKELMVRPYIPRFFREGDAAKLRVVVNNAGKRELTGELSFDILDPESGKSLLAEFGGDSGKRPFTVKAGGSTSLAFALKVPVRLGLVAVVTKATARGAGGEAVGDGESRPVPLLPSRMHLVQSRFVTLKGKATKELEFKDLAGGDDLSRLDEQLVVSLDAQLFYGVLKALPYLTTYPYECSEQVFNRYFASGLVSSVYERFPQVAKMAAAFASRRTKLETWDAQDPSRKLALEETPWILEAKGGQAEDDAALVNLLDKARAKSERDKALARLQKMQTPGGGFPWFPGGRPSPYISLYLALGFARSVEMGVPVPKDMVVRTWKYLGDHFAAEIRPSLLDPDEANLEFLALLLHALSSYPDDTWTGGAISSEDRARILDYVFKHWKKLPPLSKAHLALALKRGGRAEDAKLVFDSVLDRAKHDDERGSYFAPEERSWLWYNDTVETAAFVLRTLGELEPGHAKEEGFVQWLFLNKKLNHWKSTKATSEAIYSLVRYLSREKALGVREAATVRIGAREQTFRFEPDEYEGRGLWRIAGPDIEPKTDGVIKVEKTTPGIMFASATWHFSTEKLPARGDSDFFAVERRFFRRIAGEAGFKLEPLEEGAKLAVGDELEVQLSLSSKHAAEYVHLRDPRGAGFEPTSTTSRWQWDLGIGWYEEVRDSGTNFFFEWLPAGEYTFKYRVRATMAGAFRVGPSTVQSMYAPEFAAYSSGVMLDVAE